MYYIDDYKSGAIINKPPVNKELRDKLAVQSKSAVQSQLNAFWKIMINIPYVILIKIAPKCKRLLP